MTEHDQQIALCEWMGWKPSTAGWTYQHEGQWFPVLNSDTNDLNVLHEMEKRLDDDNHEFNQRWHFGKHLRAIVHPQFVMSDEATWWHSSHATAFQRREALLRALGLWK